MEWQMRKALLEQNRLFGTVVMAMLLALPLSLILSLLTVRVRGLVFFSPYLWMWSGFYGIVLACIFDDLQLKRSHFFKVSLEIAIFFNIFFMGLLLFASLMGGVQGFVWIVVGTIFPFLPRKWCFDLIIQLLPADKFPPV